MTEPDLNHSTARSLAAAIRARKVSPVEVLEASLARIDAVDDKVNAIVWRNDEEARGAARAAAYEVVHRDPADLPPFHGVPIPVKDLNRVAGWPVTYGSWGASGEVATESDLVVEALARGGFLLTARTNTPEFGPITAAENVRYGITRNPWNLDHTPGGSSGGAAAAVAAGMFSVAHGNDGGGSIRIPASCCGLVGLKVSRGRVPARHMSWEGGSVEGVLTRDVADTAAILDVIAGPDRGQWYNAPAPERPFLSEVGVDPGGLRIGLLEEAPLGLPIDSECAAAAREAATILEGLGHSVVPTTVDVPAEFVEAFLTVVDSGLADYEADWERVEPHIRANRARAQAIDSLAYVRAVHQLQSFTREVVGLWGRDFDVLLTPTMTIPPPRAGDVLAAAHEAAHSDGPALVVLQMAAITSAFNVTGQPAISVPLHTSPDGLPIGVQLAGGPWEEALLIRLASQLEEAVGWTTRRPSL